MVLILGGFGAGKKAYAHSLGYTGEQMSRTVSDCCPVFLDLETTVREGKDVPLDALLQKELVLCCEVGSGVIPLDRTERDWREAVGRLCVRLAEKATAVVRVTAGIPVAIKGELPCARS